MYIRSKFILKVFIFVKFLSHFHSKLLVNRRVLSILTAHHWMKTVGKQPKAGLKLLKCSFYVLFMLLNSHRWSSRLFLKWSHLIAQQGWGDVPLTSQNTLMVGAQENTPFYSFKNIHQILKMYCRLFIIVVPIETSYPICLKFSATCLSGSLLQENKEKLCTIITMYTWRNI